MAEEGNLQITETLTLSVNSRSWGLSGGPYWIRTSDLFGVNEALEILHKNIVLTLGDLQKTGQLLSVIRERSARSRGRFITL